MTNQTKATYGLALLFAINAMNFFDRQILGAVAEPIRREWELTDTALGTLGTAFTLLYAVVGLPFGRLTDKFTRTRILAAGVFVWSVLTAASGIARNYLELFIYRLGVGVGEATCAPASSSLIGDLYPASKRAKAMSVFMMGLPLGIAASFAVSGWVTKAFNDWRPAFLFAAIPGIICAVLALLMREPARGASEAHAVGARKREGSPFLLVLSIPTMWWLILSGALHNFNMYAIGSFLAPFLQRYHGQDIRQAGFTAMLVYGLSGAPGLLIGGIAGDALMRRKPNGRLLVGAISILISVPLIYLALGVEKGNMTPFMLLAGVGIGVTYAYYATVYSTIQDVIEPSLRGTAMAMYFFAMYVLGASLGPVGTGFASDFYTTKVALAAGVSETTREALEPFRAEGLRQAMMLIPWLGALLTFILFAGAATVRKDMERLQRWMRESTEGAQTPKVAAAEAAK
jgi:MFS family permease